MNRKTWPSPIPKALLLLLPLLLFALSTAGQVRQPKRYARDSKRLAERKKLEKAASDTLPLYGGIYVGADLYGIGAHLFGSDTKSGEVQIDVNLRNRFFPVVEAGYAQTTLPKATSTSACGTASRLSNTTWRASPSWMTSSEKPPAIRT